MMMKRLLILAFVAVAMLGSCKKEEITPEESILGTWEGESAQLMIYNDEGTEVTTNLTISLESPNHAEAVFNSDKSFVVDVVLTEPLPIVEHREGTYSIEGNN